MDKLVCKLGVNVTCYTINSYNDLYRVISSLKPSIIITNYINIINGKPVLDVDLVKSVSNISKEHSIPIIIITPKIKVSEKEVTKLISLLEKNEHKENNKYN
ncbi:MAG TPA: hypothetical protein EYH40_03165 [Desulfurococcales archaeon]|nr:hypothetical protein [Desulfurococcales archaeon]